MEEARVVDHRRHACDCERSQERPGRSDECAGQRIRSRHKNREENWQNEQALKDAGPGNEVDRNRQKRNERRLPRLVHHRAHEADQPTMREPDPVQDANLDIAGLVPLGQRAMTKTNEPDDVHDERENSDRRKRR